jgi:hypothetical protein
LIGFEVKMKVVVLSSLGFICLFGISSATPPVAAQTDWVTYCKEGPAPEHQAKCNNILRMLEGADAMRRNISNVNSAKPAADGTIDGMYSDLQDLENEIQYNREMIEIEEEYGSEK